MILKRPFKHWEMVTMERKFVYDLCKPQSGRMRCPFSFISSPSAMTPISQLTCNTWSGPGETLILLWGQDAVKPQPPTPLSQQLGSSKKTNWFICV